MKRFDKAIKIAIAEAQHNKNKFRLAAVAVDRRGRILSIASNEMSITHTKQKKWAEKVGKPKAEYLHAEISALLKSRGVVRSLIIVRLYRNGDLALAKPCVICDLAIKVYGVKNIVYTNNFGNFTWEKR